MIFNYLKTLQSVPLDFSSYKFSSNEIIISIGKSGNYMYDKFITEHPKASILNSLIIVPEGIEIEHKQDKNIVFSSHPDISWQSFSACHKLIDFIKDNCPSNITVLLSGGSSALIEKSNCPEQTIKNNKNLLKSGRNVIQINNERAGFSQIKNGKLAKLFPEIKWTVFVMSDIPFENGEKFVGSMPFFHYNLSNTTIFKCADSMTLHSHIKKKLKRYAFHSINYFNKDLDVLEKTIVNYIKNTQQNLFISGEPLLTINSDKPGVGGRMTHLALKILPNINERIKFYALSSDGIDGNSPYAGAVIENINPQNFNKKEMNEAILSYNSGGYLAKKGLVLKTGYTGINLNDFIILIRD